jgi:hypothetical protein
MAMAAMTPVLFPALQDYYITKHQQLELVLAQSLAAKLLYNALFDL